MEGEVLCVQFCVLMRESNVGVGELKEGSSTNHSVIHSQHSVWCLVLVCVCVSSVLWFVSSKVRSF